MNSGSTDPYINAYMKMLEDEALEASFRKDGIVVDVACDLTVENVAGSSKRPSPQCRCHGWNHHWENFARAEFPTVCSNILCHNKSREPKIEGGHVRVVDDGKIEYIVPLCSECNNSNFDGDIIIARGTTMVKVNRSETCDKYTNISKYKV